MWEKVSGQFYALLIMVLHRRMKRDLKPCRDGLAYERFWDHRGFGKLVEVPPYQDVARQKDSASRHSHEVFMGRLKNSGQCQPPSLHLIKGQLTGPACLDCTLH